MEFNSYIFVLAFLPVTVIIYHLLSTLKTVEYRKWLIAAVSFGFVAYSDYRYLYYLVASIVINYLCSLFIKKKVKGSKFVLWAGIIINILSLGYFKYTGFVLESLNKFAGMNNEIPKLLVPLGISFVTFQQIAYLVDVYRGQIPQLKISDYVFYVTYFPKYVQGPISKYDLIVNQVNDNKKISSEQLGFGLWLFVKGLAMKVLVADVFAKAVTYGWGNLEALTSMDALLLTVAFTFQIYFDFAGYSSMATGISKLLGINLKDNFDSPYQSYSIVEFWKKWHISLTDFLREYIYFPLGGSRKGKIRTYVNIMIIFTVSGLWHGGAWTFVVWGMLHGLGSVINRLIDKYWIRMHKVIQWLITFAFVNMAWVFFRAYSVNQAIEVLLKIATMQNLAISDAMINCFNIPEIAFLTGRIPVLGNLINAVRGFGLMVYMTLGFVLSLTIKDRTNYEFKPNVIQTIWSVIIFTWSVISLSGVVEFIYAGF